VPVHKYIGRLTVICFVCLFSMRSMRRDVRDRQNGAWQGALDRCRLLADQVDSNLHSKNAKQFINLAELADFKQHLGTSASVLEQNSERSWAQGRV
jgi:hypothetical protein